MSLLPPEGMTWEQYGALPRPSPPVDASGNALGFFDNMGRYIPFPEGVTGQPARPQDTPFDAAKQAQYEADLATYTQQYHAGGYKYGSGLGPAPEHWFQPTSTPTTATSPMGQQLNTGPVAPQPYTPQVGAAPTTSPTTPAANPFQPFLDAMQQYNQQLSGLQQQYQQQITDYNNQFGGQLPPISTPQPTPQATPPQTTPQPTPQPAGAPPQQFPGTTPSPLSDAMGGYGGANWPSPQRRKQQYGLGGGFGGRGY